MRVLVTGAKGFVGSHIAYAMAEDSHNVTSYDSGAAGVDFLSSPPGRGVIENIDAHLLGAEELLQGRHFDQVIHCAARADIASNWNNVGERERMWRDNIDSTSSLLEATPRTPVLFLSTLAVYGDEDNCLEDEALIATSPYAASKIAGEAMVQAYLNEFEVPWHVFRLGCVVGPHYHHGHVADFVRQGEKHDVRPLSDGRAHKSFVHVADIVQAVRMAVNGSDRLPKGVYNLSGGSWCPRDTIRVLGYDGVTTWPENKPKGWIGDPMASAHSQRLRSMGWTPRYGIKNGIYEAAEGLGWKGRRV